MRWILAVMQVNEPSLSAEGSFEDVFRQHHGFVVRFFSRRGVSPEESQDLAQETFLRAYRTFDRFRRESKVSTWLHQIAINVWRNRGRDAAAAKRDSHVVSLADDHETIPAAETAAHDRLISEEKSGLLEKAIEELPPKMRQCVVLRVLQGRRYRDIASLLDISEATVKSHVSLAKSRLQAVLAEHYPDLEAIS